MVVGGRKEGTCVTIQYSCIARCQYNCIRNVLWCQVHSSHIHACHKTSLNYSNSKHRGIKSLMNKYMRNPVLRPVNRYDYIGAKVSGDGGVREREKERRKRLRKSLS